MKHMSVCYSDEFGADSYCKVMGIYYVGKWDRGNFCICYKILTGTSLQPTSMDEEHE